MRLDESVKRLVEDQRLGFVATVCPDGTPSLSPKGTTAVFDDEHLVFLHLHSPGTVANVERNPSMEINVVDPVVRKGYRLKGEAKVVASGDLFERILDFYRRERGIDRTRVRAAVLMQVESLAPLISPVYNTGASEHEVAEHWREHHLGLHGAPAPGTVAHMDD